MSEKHEEFAWHEQHEHILKDGLRLEHPTATCMINQCRNSIQATCDLRFQSL